jgi:hypothetical protein
MPPGLDILIDRPPPVLAPSEDCESIMAYRLKWKTQPSATRICWLTTGELRRRLSMPHQDHPA